MASGYEPRVRPASATDLPQLERLGRRARDDVATQKGGRVLLALDARAEALRASLVRDLEEPDRAVLLGTLGRVPSGYAVARIEPTAAAPLAVVRELYVEPEARGVGLGRLLMATLLEWAGEAGCGGIDAEVLPGDRDTKNFFEALGLVARRITVHRALVSGSDA